MAKIIKTKYYSVDRILPGNNFHTFFHELDRIQQVPLLRILAALASNVPI